ncbi:hypothetical protein LRS13_12060 [Svornostia abyssi]|uniref:Uncharacterized protein n=1 Tax=Svornostia abyssi TaxID=2898438 RepID=A0ABY5PNL1_9ACTN|nr:hypothetical protein LRS13_12060 [Parviterribacteraceae bacterium J379]
MVPRPRDAVELQQPVAETRVGGDLPGAHLAGLLVERDDRLGTRPAGRRPDGEDRAHHVLVGVRGELRDERLALGEHLSREPDERVDPQVHAHR